MMCKCYSCCWIRCKYYLFNWASYFPTIFITNFFLLEALNSGDWWFSAKGRKAKDKKTILYCAEVYIVPNIFVMETFFQSRSWKAHCVNNSVGKQELACGYLAHFFHIKFNGLLLTMKGVTFETDGIHF